VLLQNSSGFLKTLAQRLGDLKLFVLMTPLVLPVQGQATEGQHAKTESSQGAIGSAMKASQPGGTAFDLAAREGALNQGEGAAGIRLGGAATESLAGPLGFGNGRGFLEQLRGCWLRGKRGNQGKGRALRK